MTQNQSALPPTVPDKSLVGPPEAQPLPQPASAPAQPPAGSPVKP